MSVTPPILYLSPSIGVLNILVGQLISNCVVTVTIGALLKWLFPHSVWVLKSPVNLTEVRAKLLLSLSSR